MNVYLIKYEYGGAKPEASVVIAKSAAIAITMFMDKWREEFVDGVSCSPNDLERLSIEPVCKDSECILEK